MCTTCQSLLTLTIWQGEKWSEEVTPGFYCSLQPNDPMFPFPSGILPCHGLHSARCWAPLWGESALSLPSVSGHGEHSSSFGNAQHISEKPSSSGSGRNGTRADSCFAFGPDCAFEGHEEVHYAGYEPAPALTEVSSILFLCFDVKRSRTGPAVRVIDFHQLVSGEQKAGQVDCCTASVSYKPSITIFFTLPSTHLHQTAPLH